MTSKVASSKGKFRPGGRGGPEGRKGKKKMELGKKGGRELQKITRNAERVVSETWKRTDVRRKGNSKLGGGKVLKKKQQLREQKQKKD